MPTLEKLLNNLSNFKYYEGYGNFTTGAPSQSNPGVYTSKTQSSAIPSIVLSGSKDPAASDISYFIDSAGAFGDAIYINQDSLVTASFDFTTNDYRLYDSLDPTSENYKGLYSNYPTSNMVKRIGLSRARKISGPESEVVKGAKYGTFPSTVSGSDLYSSYVDKVNMISLIYGSAIEGNDFIDLNGNNVKGYGGMGQDTVSSNALSTNDLVKFRIASYDNDDPNNKVYMVFRAFLNNINTKMLAKQTPYTYVGRGESFYVYDGFTSNISFEFKIAATSREEMQPLYQKLNYLMSTMTPDYSDKLFSRGNIMELTIGDYIKYQPGVISSLDISIEEDTNWDIAIEGFAGGNDDAMHELPMMLKCSVIFIPIFNFLPRKSSSSPFIGIDATSPNRKNGWIDSTDKPVNPTQTPPAQSPTVPIRTIPTPAGTVQQNDYIAGPDQEVNFY